MVEFRFERGKSKGLPEEVPIERFKVPQVENNPVAFRQGSIVNCFQAYNLKQFIASRASSGEPSLKLIDSGGWRHGSRIHLFSWVRARARTEMGGPVRVAVRYG
jgi:hypothetical protein